MFFFINLQLMILLRPNLGLPQNLQGHATPTVYTAIQKTAALITYAEEVFLITFLVDHTCSSIQQPVYVDTMIPTNANQDIPSIFQTL